MEKPEEARLDFTGKLESSWLERNITCTKRDHEGGLWESPTECSGVWSQVERNLGSSSHGWVREDKRKGVLLSIMNAPLWRFLERLLEKCK